jgi:hypothetical protein
MRQPSRKRQSTKTTKRRARSKRGLKSKQAAGAGIVIVNIIPKSLSSEVEQDSEPMLAVNPADPNEIVATAFTPNPGGGNLAPYFVSTDGGQTWALNPVVPGGVATADITVAFSGTGRKLYAGILRRNNTHLNDLRTTDFAGAAQMAVLEDRADSDQPFTQAATVASGVDAGKERVYIGNNDFGVQPATATIDLSLDAGNAAPVITKVRLEHRSTGSAGQDGPQIRTAVHQDGTVYATFYGWRAQSGNWQANTLKVSADVVVVRDDAWGSGAFGSLTDPGDAVIGRRVASNVSFSFNQTGLAANGQQRLGGTLSIAVDPRAGNSGTVYVAWGTDQPGTGFTIHVRRSTDRGDNWSPNDLLTVPHATNAALAINEEGVVGLLYQQLVGTGANQHWQSHFRRTTDGTTWSDVVLAVTPANFPQKSFDPYLGDYDHLLAVGKSFYGIFCASNVPDTSHFPIGVTYQRNADFTKRKLLGVNNVTPVIASIDPFFFKTT